MQDNIYEVKLNDKEYEYLEGIRQEYFDQLSKMTKKERLQYFKDNYCNETNLDFEKEINGTTYKVKTYFDENSEESILQKFLRITKKS